MKSILVRKDHDYKIVQGEKYFPITFTNMQSFLSGYKLKGGIDVRSWSRNSEEYLKNSEIVAINDTTLIINNPRDFMFAIHQAITRRST